MYFPQYLPVEGKATLLYIFTEIASKWFQQLSWFPASWRQAAASSPPLQLPLELGRVSRGVVPWLREATDGDGFANAFCGFGKLHKNISFQDQLLHLEKFRLKEHVRPFLVLCCICLFVVNLITEGVTFRKQEGM